MKPNIFFLSIFLIVFSFLLSLGMFVFLNMINNLFFNLNFIEVLYLSLIINFVFIFFYIMFNIIGSSFFMNIIRILNYYLGFLLYGFLISLIYWIILFILRFFKLEYLLSGPIVGSIIVFFFVTLSFLSIYNFNSVLNVQTFNINSSKVTKDYSFVQIADIQYGSLSKKQMINIFDLALKQNPDFIVFVGDLIDTNNYDLSDFDFLNDINIPIYFERGNHEFYHKPELLLTHLQSMSSINVLQNQQTTFEELDIVGVEFGSDLTFDSSLKNIQLDDSRYSILLYHEPKNLQAAANNGFDLVLCGHTHAGQLFPFNLLVKIMYSKFAYGFHTIGSTNIYTTSGAGLFGPRMRLGSRNEIVVFNIINN